MDVAHFVENVLHVVIRVPPSFDIATSFGFALILNAIEDTMCGG
jgi:hypothetical protein